MDFEPITDDLIDTDATFDAGTSSMLMWGARSDVGCVRDVYKRQVPTRTDALRRRSLTTETETDSQKMVVNCQAAAEQQIRCV